MFDSAEVEGVAGNVRSNPNVVYTKWETKEILPDLKISICSQCDFSFLLPFQYPYKSTKINKRWITFEKT